MSELTPAQLLVDDGQSCSEAGDAAGAERAYLKAAELAPLWAAPLFNLGLLYKHQGRWHESLDCNRKTLALAPEDQGAWWNRGIAATALGHWPEARECWTKFGLADPGGDGPPDYRLGRIPVRLDPNGDGEVVWGDRLDPARVRVTNIPLPSSEFRWGDIVLNDGAAEGERTVNGHRYPVFNVLERLVPSSMSTFVIELASVNDAAIEALEDIAAASGGAAENWGVSTSILCRQCSLGTPHEHTGSTGGPAHPHCGLAAANQDVARAILDQWLASNHVADLVSWYEVDHKGRL